MTHTPKCGGGLTYAHPPSREARRAVRWAINSAEAASTPTLCALLLPYTSVSNFKRDYTIKYEGLQHRMRVGTHILTKFHAHTLMLSTDTEPPDPPATCAWETAPTGYILLLVGNKEGLQRALNISDDLKQTFEHRLAQATKSKVTPIMDWNDPPDTPSDERRTNYGTTIERKRLTQTTAFRRIHAARGKPTDDNNKPDKIDDDEDDQTD